MKEPRQHHLDALRAMLMLLGIPLHAALPYAPGRGWAVVSPETAPAFGWLVDAIHAFRMQVFFVIAGYFSLLLIQRGDPIAWFRRRLVRLGVPLVFGSLTVGPVTVLVSALARSLSGRPDAPSVWPMQMPLRPLAWIGHLWFLVDLLGMSAVLLLAWRSPLRDAGRRIAEALQPLVESRSGRFAIPVAIGLYTVAVYGSGKLFGGIELELAGVFDLERVARFAPFFCMGMLLVRPAVLARYESTSVAVVLGAIAAIATVVAAQALDSSQGRVLTEFATPIASILAGNVLVAAARRWFARPSRVVRALADAAFTVYIVHQPFVVLVALGFTFVTLPSSVEFAAIVVATIAMSVRLHTAAARSPALMLLLNGRLPPGGWRGTTAAFGLSASNAAD